MLGFSPSQVRFDATYPGPELSRAIAARSSFKQDLLVQRVWSTDERVVPQLLTGIVGAENKSDLALVHFDPIDVFAAANESRYLNGE